MKMICLSCDLELEMGGEEGQISLICPNCGGMDLEFDSPIRLARVKERYGIEVGDFDLVSAKTPFLGRHPWGTKWMWKKVNKENSSDIKKRSKLER